MKDYFGIEGVRLQLPAALFNLNRQAGMLTGVLHLSSLRRQQLISLSLKLTERYQRGRGEQKLIDTYTLGELTTPTGLQIEAGELVELPFELSFTERLSPVETLGRRNIFMRPLTSLADKVNAATHQYTLSAEARVEGVTLNPRTSTVLELSL